MLLFVQAGRLLAGCWLGRLLAWQLAGRSLVFLFMQCHSCMWTVIDYLLWCCLCSSRKLAGCSACDMFPHHRPFFLFHFLSVFAQAVPRLHRLFFLYMYLCIAMQSVAQKNKHLLLCLGRQQRLFWLRFADALSGFLCRQQAYVSLSVKRHLSHVCHLSILVYFLDRVPPSCKHCTFKLYYLDILN